MTVGNAEGKLRDGPEGEKLEQTPGFRLVQARRFPFGVQRPGAGRRGGRRFSAESAASGGGAVPSEQPVGALEAFRESAVHMQKIESVAEMRSIAAQYKLAGQAVALVPTSGALHAGHAALIATAEARAAVVIVAIFPNPLAFGPSDNFARYPRSPEADLKLCEQLRVKVAFIPTAEEMYPRGYSTYVVEEAVSKQLCGVSRPTHFRGVTTGIAKLLNIIRPEFLVMGQRDAQQVAVVRKMIGDLCLGAEVVVAPIVREADGLAVTVRNSELTARQRQEAHSIFAALERAKEMVAQGVRSTDRVIAEATHLLGQRRMIRVIYVSIVDPNTMEPMREIVPGRTLLAIAVWIEEVRVIDNVVL
jgi:pantoate--beta-alanine ligase